MAELGRDTEDTQLILEPMGMYEGQREDSQEQLKSHLAAGGWDSAQRCLCGGKGLLPAYTPSGKGGLAMRARSCRVISLFVPHVGSQGWTQVC